MLVRIIIAVVLIILLVMAAALIAAAGITAAAAGINAAVFGGGRAHTLIWPQAPRIPAEAVAAAINAANTIGPHYGPPTEHEHEELVAAAAEIQRKWGTHLGAAQLEQIRRMERASAAMRAGSRARRIEATLRHEFESGADIVDLAKAHKLPPMLVHRLVQPGAAVTPQLAKADMESAMHAAIIRADADAFERRVGTFLRSQGVQFETEEDLRRRGVSDATPDFLLAEEVRINGHPVRWIDAKNYPMYGSALVAKNLKRQARKYNLCYGLGAMVFSGGVGHGATVIGKNDPLLLDGSLLP